MKKNETRDLRTKSVDELKRMLLDLNEDVSKLKMEKVSGRLTNPSSIRNKRHDVARVLTVLTMKSLIEKSEVITKEVNPVK